MRAAGVLFLTAASMAVTVIMALLPVEGLRVWIYVAAVVTALLMIWLWLSVVRPVSVAERGMELISGHEWNNRLVKTGEPGADRLVTLYNTLLQRLSDERIRLRERNCFLDLLIEASPTGIAVMDFDGHIEMANRSFLDMAGVGDMKEIAGKMLSELSGELMNGASAVAPGETATIRVCDMKVYRCRRLWFMEHGFRKPFVMIDSLTEEVRKAEKDAYGKIIRTISHELNNSIGGVNTFLDILISNDDLDEDFREVAASCRERNESLSLFVKSYTDIIKLPEPKLEVIDLNAMLRDMEPFLQVMGGSRVEVGESLCDGELLIKGDAVMLQQVVVNIVKNGVESILGEKNDDIGSKNETDEDIEERIDGTVMVSTRKERGDAVMELSDTGKGISPEVAGKIFTPFFTTKKKGQGLGLTFAAEVLESHDCSFSLHPAVDTATSTSSTDSSAELPFSTTFTIRFHRL